MRILGIDPGSTVTGWGVVERCGAEVCWRAHGTLRPARGGALAVRLAAIHAGLARVIAEHAPDLAVVEQVFVHANPRSALVLGHARGAALAAAAAGGLPVEEIGARQVKLAVVGSGAASKLQVQAMVQRLLRLAERPPSDAADALAAAICRAHRGARPLVERAPARPRRSRAAAFVLRRSP